MCSSRAAADTVSSDRWWYIRMGTLTVYSALSGSSTSHSWTAPLSAVRYTPKFLDTYAELPPNIRASIISPTQVRKLTGS